MKNKNFYIRLLFLLFIPLASAGHNYLNRLRPGTRIFSTKLDSLIPLEPIFAIPYLYWFIFIFILLAYFAYNNGLVFFKTLTSLVIGMLICEVIFLFFPTHVPRPTLTAIDPLTNMVRYIYSMDNPYDCFPSIHVLDAVIVTAYYIQYGKSIIMKYINILSCILICLSTLYVKQHYVPDVIAATIISLLVYAIMDRVVFHNKRVLSVLRFLD